MSDYTLVGALKAGVAACGTLLLLWDVVAARTGRSDTRQSLRDRLLAVLGVLAFALWWNLGAFHYPRFLHVHEFVHYFLGAKYQAELGYTGLYRCIARAEAENGGAGVASRWIRNLDTNVLEPGARTLEQAAVSCPERFTLDRWREFRNDVGWFRRRMSDEKWQRLTLDHGYNATPAWTMTGTLLANLGPASRGFVQGLALIDPALYLVMWACVWWAFGWRTMCVSLLWWGTNYPARFSWTGGAFLRADWLTLLVVGICLLKKGRPAISGAALGLSATLRIFPAAVALGPGLKSLWSVGRGRREGDRRRALAFGSGLAAALVLSLFASSLVIAGRWVDLGTWDGFARNSRKHLGQASPNRMGLKVALSFEEKSRIVHVRNLWMDSPWDAWHAARERVFERRRWIFWTAVAAYLVALAYAVRRHEHWEAAALSVGILPFALELACYYYACLLVLGFLWLRDRAVGVALVATAFASSLPPAIWSNSDDVYVAESLLTVLLVVAVTTAMSFSRPPTPAPGQAG